MQVLDYSSGPPAASAVKAAGFGGAARYLAPLPNPKVIGRREADDFLSAQLGLTLVFERGDSRALGGGAAGKDDGALSALQAGRLGAPADVCVFMAVDFGATPVQLGAVAAYLDGARGPLAHSGYRVGVYGSELVCRTMLDDGHAHLAWQTVAWSGGRRERRAVLFQTGAQVRVAGVLCDVNDVLAADWGQWPRPAPPPPTPTEELFMGAFTDDDDARRFLIRQACATYWGREPTGDEQTVILVDWHQHGGDLTLAHIIDSPHAAGWHAAQHPS